MLRGCCWVVRTTYMHAVHWGLKPPSTHASACSGDDIANVCNEAAHNVLRRELAGRCAGWENTPAGVV